MTTSDLTVVGMGYVGMSAALALVREGYRVTCVGPLDPQAGARDTRSTALFPESVALLQALDVWSLVEHACRPLKGIRIVDGTRTLLRAPEITFRADECGLEALAVNVPNRVLHHAMITRLREWVPTVDCHDATVDAVHSPDSAVNSDLCLTLSNGTELHSTCTIAADGRNSRIRDAAEISVKRWSYDQVALACTVRHSARHDDISTEFHHAAGPLTTVPGPAWDDGDTSHLVWIETADAARSLIKLDEEAFRLRLDSALHGLLGTLHETGPRASFPIRGQTARCFARNKVFLVGETAHVIPPIGAQGMNLGLRDVRGLLTAFDGTTDRTAAERLYNEDRHNDVWVRTTAVDLLNRSLTTPYWPVQALRGAGLHMLNLVPSLKRAVIQAGFGN